MLLVMQSNISQILGVKVVKWHSKYLDLPMVVGRLKKQVFSMVKDQMWKKLKNWKKRFLSKLGKEILIKSVAQSIPTYIMNYF